MENCDVRIRFKNNEPAHIYDNVIFNIPFSPSEQTPVLEHVQGVRMQGPIGPFARPVWSSGYFHETVIKGQIMSQGVLPPLRVPTVIWKPFRNKAINVRQWQHLLR